MRACVRACVRCVRGVCVSVSVYAHVCILIPEGDGRADGARRVDCAARERTLLVHVCENFE